MTIKPAEFLGDSIEALRAFPEHARQDAEFQLDKVQRGEEPDDWKPMGTIGAGVKEIRIRDEAGAFRVIYLAKLADAVYIPCIASRRIPARKTSSWPAAASKN